MFLDQNATEAWECAVKALKSNSRRLRFTWSPVIVLLYYYILLLRDDIEYEGSSHIISSQSQGLHVHEGHAHKLCSLNI